MNSSWKLCPLLIILITACIRKGVGIKCWECRSDSDPACNDPFDNSTVALTNCDYVLIHHLPDVRSTMCRKIRQNVNGNWRIIRGCAFLGEVGVGGNETICQQRHATDQTFVEYCTCNNKDGCNS